MIVIVDIQECPTPSVNVVDSLRQGRQLDQIRCAKVAQLVISKPVIEVAEELLDDGVVPKKAADDAFHIACAGVHRVDFLLTWNCNHIANPHNRHRIRKCFTRHQLEMPVICTPEEFIGDDY